MTDKDAKNIAHLPDVTAAGQEAIDRLNRNGYIELPHVQIAHDWLDRQRQSLLLIILLIIYRFQ
jgi:hypothetical protein